MANSCALDNQMKITFDELSAPLTWLSEGLTSPSLASRVCSAGCRKPNVLASSGPERIERKSSERIWADLSGCSHLEKFDKFWKANPGINLLIHQKLNNIYSCIHAGDIKINMIWSLLSGNSYLNGGTKYLTAFVTLKVIGALHRHSPLPKHRVG